MSTATATRKSPPTPKEKHWLLGHVNMLRDDAIGMIRGFIEGYGSIYSLSIPFHKGID